MSLDDISSPDVTPPLRLRRWAAALFGVTFLGHIYWLLFYLYSGDTNSVGCMVASYLDCLTLFTTIPGTLFAMLQDRKRHVWLYLQHDLTLLLLAQILGTNRSYLSQYFSHQGITYNTYINNLRIDHFTKLYREAAASDKTVTAQQLASGSGFRSYSTFSLAFKQRMGQSVTVWMQKM